MKTRNKTVYRATLSGLKGDAFGISHTFEWLATVELYQARVSPECWRSRPSFERQGHRWQAGSAERLMEIITRDFDRLVKPWRAHHPDGSFTSLDLPVIAAQNCDSWPV